MNGCLFCGSTEHGEALALPVLARESGRTEDVKLQLCPNMPDGWVLAEDEAGEVVIIDLDEDDE